MISNEIWIYAECHLNMIQPVTYQLISKANEIKGNKKVVVVLLETPNQQLEDQLIAYGPDEIIIVKDKRIEGAADSLLADLIAQLARHRKPNSILFGATVVGRSVSARLQAKLLTGLTADCLDLKYEEDLLIQIKPSYGDNIMCEIICPNHRPQMATVRPNIFVGIKHENKDLIISNVDDLVFKDSKRIIVNKERALLSKSDNIANASRVIAIGRGMGSEKNIKLVIELASKLGAKIGVTRPLTDTTPFSVDDQIGQSGNSISPRLLITLGVHGAVQFTTGIGKSELVIAVNNNKDAPIFDYADYSFIGDSTEFVEELLKIVN